jgi:calcineurin-like phosphoesterase family protein
MRNIWFASDHHLFHRNILTFRDDDGKLVRKFDDIDQHNDCILTKHNEQVKENDIVYFMGDLTFSYGDDFKSFFAKFKGRKRLLVGNHDDVKKLVPFFQKIQIWRVFKDKDIVYPFTVTHVPIDTKSIKGFFNVHGHIHQNKSPTPSHINLSMEAINYTPVSLDELQYIMKEMM